MFEYLVPVVEIQIGDFLVRRTVELRLVTGRANPVDRARIVLPVQGLDPSVVELDAPVQIRAGYREKGLWPLFTGTVCDLAWSQQVRLLCKDRMDSLRSVRITQAFVDATPKDVVSKVLDVAGVTNRQISDSVQDRRHYYVLSGQNAIESIRLVNRSWGLEDWAFFFSPEPDGGFWWGPWEESPRIQDGEVLRLEHGKNILELTPFNRERRGVVQTIFLPYLRHSQLVRVRDMRFWKRDVLVRAERIFHHVTEKKARTTIEWTLVSWS
jgi:hypothetical protein